MGCCAMSTRRVRRSFGRMRPRRSGSTIWGGLRHPGPRIVGQPDAGGRTPSDLALVALSQEEIERLEERYPRIEDILPLSPLQEGLLFHALYDAQAPDVYTVQLVLDLEGPLDEAVLKASAG